MNRSLTGTILWTCLAGLLGATLFFIKHEVKDLESRLASVNRDIGRNMEDIHVLNAEWSFLNDPVRLRDLAERHLGMKQMGPTQMANLNTLKPTSATALAQASAPSLVATQTATPLAVVKATQPIMPQAKPALPAHNHMGGGTGLAMVSTGETR